MALQIYDALVSRFPSPENPKVSFQQAIPDMGSFVFLESLFKNVSQSVSQLVIL